MCLHEFGFISCFVFGYFIKNSYFPFLHLLFVVTTTQTICYTIIIIINTNTYWCILRQMYRKDDVTQWWAFNFHVNFKSIGCIDVFFFLLRLRFYYVFFLTLFMHNAHALDSSFVMQCGVFFLYLYCSPEFFFYSIVISLMEKKLFFFDSKHQ